MNELKTVFEILSGLKVENQDIPIMPEHYSGNGDTYLTYTYIQGLPALSSDDTIDVIKKRYDVDLYFRYAVSDTFINNVLKEIRKRMRENDFEWQCDNGEIVEIDTLYHHITMEFERIETEEI